MRLRRSCWLWMLSGILFAGGCSLNADLDGKAGAMGGLRAVDGRLISALDAHDCSLSIVKYTNSVNRSVEERLFFLSERNGLRQLYSSVRQAGELLFSSPQPVNIFTTNTAIITAQAVAVSNMVCVFATGYQDGSYRSAVWTVSPENPVDFTEIGLEQSNPDSCVIGVLPPGTMLPNLQISAGTIGLLYVSAAGANSSWSRISCTVIAMEQLVSGYVESVPEVVLPAFAGLTVSGGPASGGIVSTVSVLPRSVSGLDCDLLLYGRLNRYGNFDLAVSDGTERDFVFDSLVGRYNDHSPFYSSGDGQLYFVSDGHTDIDRRKMNMFYWELLPLRQTVAGVISQKVSEFYRTVTFDTLLTGTSADKTVVLAKNRILFWPEEPFRTGFLFTGWTNSSGVVFSAVSNAVMPAGDLVLSPRWGVDTAVRTVTFLANGGSGTMAPQVMSTNGDSSLLLNAFVKTGSNFNGWALSAEGPPLYADGAVLPAGGTDISLYATWQLMTNRLILDRNGADQVSNASPVLLAYNDSCLLQTNLYTRNGYLFSGWSPTVDGAVVYTNGYVLTMGETDVTLYAQWTLAPTTRIITFSANGGSGAMEPQTMPVEAGFPLNFNLFTRTGYSFNGWALSAGGTAVYSDGGDMPAGIADITLYADWIVMTNRLILDRNGADQVSNVAPVLLAYNEAFSLPENPYSRSGYVFTGWSPNAGGGVIFTNGDSITMGETDITLYAQWVRPQMQFFLTLSNGSMDPAGGTSVMCSPYDLNSSYPDLQVVGGGAEPYITVRTATREAVSFVSIGLADIGNYSDTRTDFYAYRNGVLMGHDVYSGNILHTAINPPLIYTFTNAAFQSADMITIATRNVEVVVPVNICRLEFNTNVMDFTDGALQTGSGTELFSVRY